MALLDTLAHVIQLFLGLGVAVICFVSLRFESKEQRHRWAKVLVAVFGLTIAMFAVVSFITGQAISSRKDQRIQELEKAVSSGWTWDEINKGKQIK